MLLNWPYDIVLSVLSGLAIILLRKRELVLAQVLAHQIRTSEILPWDRKSYLTHGILPRLSCESCTLVVLECMRHSRQMRSSYHVASQRTRELLRAFFNMKIQYLIVSKKNNPLVVWGWDRKPRPSASPFVMTRQASECQTVILGRDFPIPPSW